MNDQIDILLVEKETVQRAARDEDDEARKEEGYLDMSRGVWDDDVKVESDRLVFNDKAL